MCRWKTSKDRITFRRMRLNYENCYCEKSLIAQNFDGSTLKMKAVNDI